MLTYTVAGIVAIIAGMLLAGHALLNFEFPFPFVEIYGIVFIGIGIMCILQGMVKGLKLVGE